MNHREFQQFQIEFRELTRRLKIDHYALALILEAEPESGEVSSVVASRVLPGEDPRETIMQLQVLLKALGLLLFELSEKGLGMRNQQAVGMLHGLLIDISDEIDTEADELYRERIMGGDDDDGEDDNWN